MLMRPRGRASSGGGGGGGKTGPANIGLLTYTASHNAPTSCRDALVSGGHTVTIIYDQNTATHDFSQYDLIITVRTANSRRSEIAAKLNGLNDAGMPLIVGGVESGISATASAETHITLMGITGTVAIQSNEPQIDIIRNDHPATQGVTMGTHQLTTSSTQYLASVAAGQSFVGDALAHGTVSYVADLPAIIAMDTGTPRLTSGVLGAPIVFFPTYLISGAYTELHQTLLNQAVEWAI